MTEDEQRPDIPKMMGAIGTTAPLLVVRLGVSYLRLKRRANKASRTFVTELERSGVPTDLARKLGSSYESDISIRKFLERNGGGAIQGIRFR